MPRTQSRASLFPLTTAIAAALTAATACSAPEQSGDPDPGAAGPAPATAAASPSPVVNLVAAGDPAFGIFSGPTTSEQGALMGQNRELDFVFYSLESGPFDIMAGGRGIVSACPG